MGAPWSIPILLAAAVILLVFYMFGRRIVRSSLTVRRALWCPFRNTNVRVDFKESGWAGGLVDVDSCTAFAPASDVVCDKGCLNLRVLPTLRTGTGTPAAKASQHEPYGVW